MAIHDISVLFGHLLFRAFSQSLSSFGLECLSLGLQLCLSMMSNYYEYLYELIERYHTSLILSDMTNLSDILHEVELSERLILQLLCALDAADLALPREVAVGEIGKGGDAPD